MMPPRHNPVEQLPALVDLHHQMHDLSVLVRVPQPHDIGVRGQGPHDLHLPSHILDIDRGPELPLGDGLVGEDLPGFFVDADRGDAELPPAELHPEGVAMEERHRVGVPEDKGRGEGQDGDGGGRGRGGGGGGGRVWGGEGGK